MFKWFKGKVVLKSSISKRQQLLDPTLHSFLLHSEWLFNTVWGMCPSLFAPHCERCSSQTRIPHAANWWLGSNLSRGERRHRSADKPSPAAVMPSARINSGAVSQGWKDKAQAVFSHPLLLKVTTNQPLIQLKSLQFMFSQRRTKHRWPVLIGNITSNVWSWLINEELKKIKNLSHDCHEIVYSW